MTSKDKSPIWLFDLDNTLHNASASAFPMLDVSMNAYVMQHLQVDAGEADRLRKAYWRRYGATLLGLVRHHGVKPAHFLDETHAMAGLESRLRSHPHDMAALRRLPGRKYVLTNAPAVYAGRVLRHLGIAHLFDDVISIEGMRMFGHWRPKPDIRMFRRLVAKLRVAAQRCVLVEDTLVHQKSARRIGIKSVWMQRWTVKISHGPEVGVHLRRRPVYVCARISSLQQLRKRVRHE